MPNYPYTFQLPPLNVQDIPNDGVAGEFLGINGSGVLDWLTAGGTGDMLKADNLSGLTSYPTARTNLGLGTSDSPTFANLTLTSPSLVSSAPVTISQTWNNAAVAFTGLKVNAVSTASAAGSLLLDLQVGGVSQFSVRKDGFVQVAGGMASPGGIYTSASANLSFGWLNSYTFGLSSAGILGWTSGSDARGAPDTILLRDGANTLALRNGANAQTFNVYGTYTSGTSYERLTLSAPSAANAIIGTNKGSGGGTARGLEFQTDGVTRMTIPATGGATVNTVAYGNNYINLSPDSINFLLLKRASDSSTVSFYTNSNQSNTLSQGVHSLFELLWSSGAGAAGAYDIGIRRASAGVLQISNTASNTFGFIQGKLRTETAYTATTVVPTGFLTLYDSNGTAYRVPCVAAP